MGELARNAGFVEESYGDRSFLRPVARRNSQKPNGCARGNSCRYSRNEHELRLVTVLARQNRKVRHEDIRAGRVSNLPNVGGATASNQPWGMNEDEIPAFRAVEQTVSPCEAPQSSISCGNFGVDYETNPFAPSEGGSLSSYRKEPHPFSTLRRFPAFVNPRWGNVENSTFKHIDEYRPIFL